MLKECEGMFGLYMHNALVLSLPNATTPVTLTSILVHGHTSRDWSQIVVHKMSVKRKPDMRVAVVYDV